MQTRRWVNQSQPQTLFFATMLLYFNVVWIILGSDTLLGLALGGQKVLGVLGMGSGQTIENLSRLFVAVGGAGAGYLIAGEKKIGYYLGIAVAALPLVARVIIVARFQVSPFKFDLTTLLFEIAEVALILHTQSRNYVRLWFK